MLPQPPAPVNGERQAATQAVLAGWASRVAGVEKHAAALRASATTKPTLRSLLEDATALQLQLEQYQAVLGRAGLAGASAASRPAGVRASSNINSGAQAGR